MFTISQLQRILKGYYLGVIDGIVGPKTEAAVAAVVAEVNRAKPADLQFSSHDKIVAVQWQLKNIGCYLGEIDGKWGSLSEAALLEWETFEATGKMINHVVSNSLKPSTNFTLYSTVDAISKFGSPGKEIESRLVSVPVPYPLRLEWDTSTVVTKIRLHKLVADHAAAAFEAIAKSYSAADIERLRINWFSGSYAYRRVRGGTTWSKHAFGIAMDFYATANGLMTPWRDGAFSAPVYEPMVAAFEGQGFASLGKIMGRDGMHFEMAKGIV